MVANILTVREGYIRLPLFIAAITLSLFWEYKAAKFNLGPKDRTQAFTRMRSKLAARLITWAQNHFFTAAVIANSRILAAGAEIEDRAQAFTQRAQAFTQSD